MAGQTACLARAGANEPVYWSSHDLAIPYRFNAANAQQATEVVLYYSADQGRSWRRAGSALPSVRSFRFTATGDGEHWFAIRTYDATGRATPPTALSPEMRVVVDTAKPTLDALDATLDERGLAVRMTAGDAVGVDPASIHVYAQADGRGGWLPVPMSPEFAGQGFDAPGASTNLTGHWRPPVGTRHVALRATVEDLAGNRTERETSAVQSEASSPIVSSTPSFGPAFATNERDANPSFARRPVGAAADPFAAAEGATTRFASAGMSSSFSSGSFASDEPARRRTFQPPAPEVTPWPADRNPSRPLLAGDADRQSPAPRRASPFGTASFGGADPRAEFDSLNAASQTPPSRLVNSTEFEFDYELEETGRWGVAKVELWGTDDGGESWRRYAIDSDRQSPIHVQTPGEGEYGFRLLVESIGGLAPATPRPGDRPEATVGVDLRRPRVVLRGARQGDGYFGDQLIIDWDADDEHLAGRPIDLFYSSRATGPWVPVATNLPNTGRHSWRLQRHLPSRMHLRLEARDEAGNVGAAVTPSPIEIAVPNASGKLRAVRPAG